MSEYKIIKVVLIIPGNKDDYLTSDIVEGLLEYENENKIQIYAYVSQLGNGIQHKHIINEKSLYKYINCIDLVFVFCQNPHFPSSPDTLEGSYLEILDKLAKHWDNFWNKTSYIDGTEYNWSSKTQYVPRGTIPRIEPFNFNYLKNKCKYYFKRECYQQDIDEGFIPLPFAYSLNRRYLKHLKDIPKEIDVFCSFPQIGTGLRIECIYVCRTIKSINVDLSNDLSYEDYCKTIKKSYISLDAWGGGQVNARPWEIIANGSVLFRQKYSVVIPNDFIVSDGKENKDTEMIVEFSSPEELYEKLSSYLNDKNHLLEMSKRSTEHLLKYHTCRARVNYMFGKMGII